jgi:predicted transporter
MTADKLKQYVAMIGGILGALLLFIRAVGHEISWFNEMTIEAFLVLLTTLIPLAAVFYGIYKNQYLLSDKAKRQEEVLKDEGLK